MYGRWIRRAAAALGLSLCLTACSGGTSGGGGRRDQQSLPVGKIDTSLFLKIVDDNPDTVDPQCTSEFYTVGLNVFDRLVEIQTTPEGGSEIVPSLAESWEISPDGLSYAFRLHEKVKFSNGSPLTTSDVGYTLERLLTHPDSCNQDIAASIKGAAELMAGETNTLEGFQAEDDYRFTITLDQPYAAFLACLSTPGASILDEESTREAGKRFGVDPSRTVGTGPFVFREWTPGTRMILSANQNCWSGPPRCAGLDIQIVSDSEAQRLLFERGSLDILDLDNLGTDAEYFVHGDIYQDLLRQGPRVGISYIALNQSVEPLNDVRVRRALQLALDRQLLLNAAYSGRGTVENGIFPRGLIGFNPDLPEIPCDPAEARRLLEEAGYGGGFELPISYSAASTQTLKDLLHLAASMWRSVGVRAILLEMSDEAYGAQRRSGKQVCYTSTWSADFNDPDNFIYTFFGTPENTASRSLFYGDQAVMERVRNARAIVDEEERLAEYQELERKIVQEDAAWIPLFSRQHYFVVSQRVDGFQVSWNGWSSNNYRNVAVAAR